MMRTVMTGGRKIRNIYWAFTTYQELISALNVILSYSHNNMRKRYYYFSYFVSEDIEAHKGELTYLGSPIKKWQSENFN